MGIENETPAIKTPEEKNSATKNQDVSTKLRLWLLTMALACARLDLLEMMPQGLSSPQLWAGQGM